MEKDLSETIATSQVEVIRFEMGKLEVQPGDIVVIRKASGLPVSRAEATRIRNEVITALDEVGITASVLFVDGFELAVIRQITGGRDAS